MPDCSGILSEQCAAQSIGVASSSVTDLVQILVSLFCGITGPQSWPEDYGNAVLNGGSLDNYDFIIIGSGAAGSVIAGRLSDEFPSQKMLLLEAGGNPPIESEIPGFQTSLFRSKYDWYYSTETNNKSCLIQPTRSVSWTRGKMLGGTTSLNGMTYFRGNRQDFDSWAKFGNPTWDWDSVLKNYRKLEDFKPSNPYNLYGTGGPIVIDTLRIEKDLSDRVLEAASEMGYQYVDQYRDGHFIGYSHFAALTLNGSRNSPAKAFIQKPKPNLDIIKNAVATRILFDKRRKARSVEFVYTDKDNRQHHLKASCIREIIISAGVVESPKLLMLSGIGPKDHLQTLGIPVISDLPVGNNVQDHVGISLAFKMSRKYLDKAESMYEFLMHHRGSLTSVLESDVNGFLDIKNVSGIYPNMQILHTFLPDSVTAKDITSLYSQWPVFQAPERSGSLAMYVMLQKPKSRGYIRLKSANYLDKPIIYPNYLDNYSDVRLFIDTIREVRKFENTPTFRRYNMTVKLSPLEQCSQFQYDTDPYWECYVRHVVFSSSHPVGSVKMGPQTDPDAVVDWQLRVRGVRGLRIADSSIIPEITSVNTMATTILIGEKCFNFLKDEWWWRLRIRESLTTVQKVISNRIKSNRLKDRIHNET